MSTQKNTKPLLGILLGTLSLFIALNPSLAKAEKFKTYVGLDLSYITLNHAKVGARNLFTNQDIIFDYGEHFAGNFPGLGLYLGGRTESIGLEIGWNPTAEVTKKSIALDGKTPVTIKTSLPSLTFDALFFFPLDEKKTFELIVSFGIANTTNNLQTAGIVSGVSKESETKPRIRVGLHYEITSQLKLRAMAGWQDAHFYDASVRQGSANFLYHFTLGVNYSL